MDRYEYFQIQLIDWVVVIDLFTDKKFMKSILNRGLGYTRCKKNDEVSCITKYIIYFILPLKKKLVQYKIIIGDQTVVEKDY